MAAEEDQWQSAEPGSKIAGGKTTAPTRPHPRTPPSPGVLKTAGPVAAAADKARDAVTGRGDCPGLLAPHCEVTHPPAGRKSSCSADGGPFGKSVRTLRGRCLVLARHQRPAAVACSVAIGGARAAYAGLWPLRSVVPVALWLDHGFGVDRGVTFRCLCPGRTSYG